MPGIAIKIKSLARGIKKTTIPETRRLIIYLSSWLALYVVSLLVGMVPVQLSIPVYISDGVFAMDTAGLPFLAVFEIIAFGPVLSMVMAWVFR